MIRRGLVVAAATVIWVALSGQPVGAQQADAPRCLGKAATIVGTAGSDTIHGTGGPDVIVGAGGGDTVYGLGGDDRICVNALSHDYTTVVGGRGDDRLRGSGSLIGRAGADIITAPKKPYYAPHIYGGPGDDVLRALGGGSFMPGPGNDLVTAATRGPNTFDFNFVSFIGSRRGVVVNLRTGIATGQGHDVLVGIDAVRGSRHGDVMYGDGQRFNIIIAGAGNDVLFGRDGGDYLFAGHGDDRIDGGRGNDYLDGDKGRDDLFGSTGNDYLHERRPEPNLVLGGAGSRDDCFGSYTTPPTVERGCERHHTPPGGDLTNPYSASHSISVLVRPFVATTR
jgi:Ca2+-binding RTX toxin-like protein